MGQWSKDLVEILTMFIAVAALALLVSHASGTSEVIGSGASGFDELLSTVENPGSGGSQGVGVSAQFASPSLAQYSIGS